MIQLLWSTQTQKAVSCLAALWLEITIRYFTQNHEPYNLIVILGKKISGPFPGPVFIVSEPQNGFTSVCGNPIFVKIFPLSSGPKCWTVQLTDWQPESHRVSTANYLVTGHFYFSPAAFFKPDSRVPVTVWMSCWNWYYCSVWEA